VGDEMAFPECQFDTLRPARVTVCQTSLKVFRPASMECEIGWQRICVMHGVMMKLSASLLFLVLLVTACSTPRTAPTVRFNEQDNANLIVRYYTDDTSYVLKPARTEGPFLSILKKDDVLDVAKHQPGRELAVVILIRYCDESQDAAVRQQWASSLTEAGYQRVVFLRGLGGTKVNGLPILAKGG
jgi:hypothetical protein